MCGITGFVNNSKPPSVLTSMAATINRRGPDDEGNYIEAGVNLAHKRLSIIDLSSAGHQPMRFNKTVIVFNGEIYNYQEIQKELIQKGYQFSSSSDTEVILKAFDCWGMKCLDHFIGMFAFALYDEENERLWLVRDRAGVKPLYYHYKNNTIAFGSELKCFKDYLEGEERNELDTNAIAEFFSLGYISSNLSILKNVKKLPPAHYLKFDSSGISINRYWDISFVENKDWLARKEDDLLEELEALIISAFKYRMVADVPVGVFLSAGIDSSLVSAVLSRHFGQINTFTIGFKEKDYDESAEAEKIAAYLKTKHTTAFLYPDKAFEILNDFYSIYDEPHADNSCVPTTFVSEIAKNSGVKVVLSADAGDELFGGYARYPEYLDRWKQINKFGKAARNTMGALVNVAANFSGGMAGKKMERFSDILKANDFIDFYQYIIRSSSAKELGRIVNGYNNPLFSFNKQADPMSQMMEWDFKRYMTDDILVKVDRATMYHSIEGREPFLDHRLVEFAAQLPVEWKLRNGETKYLLKKLLGRYMPEHLFRLPKRGFGAPIQLWMKEHYKADIAAMIKNGLFVNPYLNNDYTHRLLNDFIKGKAVNPILIWHLYSFQKWYNTWNNL
jgi:asparagine synthase (glutamine-hydrolysing)